MTDLVVVNQAYMPIMSIESAVQRYNTIVEFVRTVMKENVDYGIIPGATKKTLYKAGAERLLTLFGLTTKFVVVERTEDWTGADHGGEPFFYYWYRCQLWRGDLLVAESDGSCNSFESKYRWREQKRGCPTCGKSSIIKGKEEFGGGWLCYAKFGGCGAKFRNGDQSIEGQSAGKIPNPDICDIVNTLQKMAQKRAMIAAVLIGVNASEFFTQDMEDLAIGDGASYVPGVQVVNTTTGEVVDMPKSDTIIGYLQDWEDYRNGGVLLITSDVDMKDAIPHRIVVSSDYYISLEPKLSMGTRIEAYGDWRVSKNGQKYLQARSVIVS